MLLIYGLLDTAVGGSEGDGFELEHQAGDILLETGDKILQEDGS